jgi:purine nucleosidase
VSADSGTPVRRTILLDCDPGHDDAIAILLAAGTGSLELAGITTVAGNQTLDKTTRNACAVATVAGLEHISVVAGCDRPLLRELRTAAQIHGESGLDGPSGVSPSVSVRPGHGSDFIAETILAHPGEITLVATGPLTNVGLALRRHPGICGAVREVVIMGGAYGRGNVTPVAEFNIFVDPEAAAMVFDAPWHVTMIGLDLTHQATCPPTVQESLRSLGTGPARFADQLLTFYRRAYLETTGLVDPPVHDACAVAFVAAPELFETRPAHVRVETSGTLTAGATVTNFSARAPRGGHDVAVKLDTGPFWDLLLDAISRLAEPGRSETSAPLRRGQT